ncbi:MAG: DUF1989 domain-containing protein [Actinobacteria bacterium]|nr:DUF1989 domain-containing protein [Actinomycetota bacterium]
MVDTVSVSFTVQQFELFERQAEAVGKSPSELIEGYLRDASSVSLDLRDVRIGPGRRRVDWSERVDFADLGDLREELRFEPVSGKAIPLQAGEVLLLRQFEGGQTIDFNAFNLRDYKECMSVGHSRRQGFHLHEGDVILSNSPRIRPMFYLLQVPDTCKVDTLAARCTAPLFELRFGFEWHTNCQDTIAEAIREYGLTPDDVHDSCNFFQNTMWDEEGIFWSDWNSGRPGDTVLLVACMDVLAVPVVCGSGDVTVTSNFSYKPIEVNVYAGSGKTASVVDAANEAFIAKRSSIGPDGYRNGRIKADRELRPDPNYRPDFRRYPMDTKTVEVAIDSGIRELVQKTGAQYGWSEEEAIRRIIVGRAVGAV